MLDEQAICNFYNSMKPGISRQLKKQTFKGRRAKFHKLWPQNKREEWYLFTEL